MTWEDQQRRVPPGGATWSERQGRRDWVAAGPGPFGITDVGLPAASGTLAGLLHREPEASVTPAGLGLPPTRFLQQPPGSVSFLDAENEAGTSALTRTGKASSPAASPAWRWGPGGGLPVGLRAPSGPTYAATVFQPPGFSPQAVTGFEPAWGEPPHVDALTWNPERLLYEPDDEGMRLERGYLKAFYEHFRDMASRQVYVQAYREGAGTASWAYRWVRATTPWPEQGSPYEVLGPYGQYALDTTGQRPTYPVLAEATGPGQGLPYEQRTAVTLTPGPYAGPELRIDTPGYGRLPPPERALSDYAWVPQDLLPKGCPYSEPYLPVPLPDYTSGRWLEPDYTPSYPLPRPYDQLPAWRCGVPQFPGQGRGKGGGVPGAPPDASPQGGSASSVGLGRLLGSGAGPAPTVVPRSTSSRPGGFSQGAMQDDHIVGDASVQLARGRWTNLAFDESAPGPGPAEKFATLERNATRLEEQLTDRALSTGERDRLLAQLNVARLELAAAYKALREAHGHGSLPGPVPPPSGATRRALAVDAMRRAGAARTRDEADAIQAELDGYGGPPTDSPQATLSVPAPTASPTEPAPPVVAPAPAPPATQSYVAWDPRKSVPPGNESPRYTYWVTAYADYSSFNHVLVRLTVFDNVQNEIIWDRTFSWLDPNLPGNGWAAFSNDGAERHPKGDFPRHPFTHARDWTVDRHQFERALAEAAWWIDHRDYDRENGRTCIEFAWSVMGAAGINPFDKTSGTGGATAAAHGSGLGDPTDFKRGARLPVGSIIKRLTDYWGMKDFGGEWAIAANVGADLTAGNRSAR